MFPDRGLGHGPHRPARQLARFRAGRLSMQCSRFTTEVDPPSRNSISARSRVSGSLCVRERFSAMPRNYLAFRDIEGKKLFNGSQQAKRSLPIFFQTRKRTSSHPRAETFNGCVAILPRLPSRAAPCTATTSFSRYCLGYCRPRRHGSNTQICGTAAEPAAVRLGFAFGVAASCGATGPLASPSIPGRRSDDGCELPNSDPAKSHH